MKISLLEKITTRIVLKKIANLKHGKAIFASYSFNSSIGMILQEFIPD